MLRALRYIAMSTSPALKPTQEVRFAVVMYGGVSLAIYMNGVAQEMLHLVRATAPATAHASVASSNVESTESVYRTLGRMLEYGQEPKLREEVSESSPILTRFNIDVISGTSAGGINGVFLAKALANNQQMTMLKRLWIQEGDFGKLMNDKKRFPSLAPATQSLLDGKYMYSKLLDALDGMEDPDSMDKKEINSPFVEELDLFVTATDISGLTLPIRLANGVVNERRHRNVFHFAYASGNASGERCNDFSRRFNPFLAFASRCTSSFPVAFEPMRLSDIDDVVRKSRFFKSMRRKSDLPGAYLSGDANWRKFYVDYIADRSGKGAEENARDFLKRSFGDGGYLDNKPFSYATDALLRRSAELPVARKLIFVDPDPQNPEKQPDFDSDIDVLQNTMSALTPTVSTETIREDIQRIMDRNRLIERLKHVTQEVDEDVMAWEATNQREDRSLERDNWVRVGLDEMIKRKGISYGGYHRLKVAALTGELAAIVVDALNLEVDSDEFTAIRELIRAWRDQRYDERETSSGKPSQNKFVMDFDINYRLRRLSFLRSKINELSYLAPKKLISTLKKLMSALKDGSRVQLPNDDSDAEVAEFREKLQPMLANILKELNKVYITLLETQRKYHRRGHGGAEQPSANNERQHPLREHCRRAGIGPAELEEILDKAAGENRERYAERFLQEKPASMAVFNEIAELIAEDFKATTINASQRCEALLKPPKTGELNDVELTARTALWHYYQNYENYDMVIFPVLHQAGIGEQDIIDIIRISPYDATSLIKLHVEEDKGESGRRKLGGVALGHFGAFFEQTWRENDIMWGRLDAAEVIIKTLLPVPAGDEAREADRDQLIAEAHKAIVKEELVCWGEEELRKKIVGEFLDRSSSLDKKVTLKKLRKQLENTPQNNVTLKKVLDSCLNEEELLGYLKEEYEVSRQPDPEHMVQLLARSTKVIGRMLEALAEKHRVGSKRVAWVTRLGQIFWGLVEVAVPGSFWNLLFRQWIKLLYVFEAFLIVGGILLLDEAMQRFGFVLLAITGTTHACVKLLGDYMRSGRFRFLRSLSGIGLIILASIFIASAALGFDDLLKVLDLKDWAAAQPSVVSVSSQPLIKWYIEAEPKRRALALIGIVPVFIVLCILLFSGGKLAIKLLVKTVSKLSNGLTAAFSSLRERAR